MLCEGNMIYFLDYLFATRTRSIELTNATALFFLAVFLFSGSQHILIVHTLPPYFVAWGCLVLALSLLFNINDGDNEKYQGYTLLLSALLWVLLSACMINNYPPLNLALSLILPFSVITCASGVYLIESNR